MKLPAVLIPLTILLPVAFASSTGAADPLGDEGLRVGPYPVHALTDCHQPLAGLTRLDAWVEEGRWLHVRFEALDLANRRVTCGGRVVAGDGEPWATHVFYELHASPIDGDRATRPFVHIGAGGDGVGELEALCGGLSMVARDSAIRVSECSPARREENAVARDVHAESRASSRACFPSACAPREILLTDEAYGGEFRIAYVAIAACPSPS